MVQAVQQRPCWNSLIYRPDPAAESRIRYNSWTLSPVTSHFRLALAVYASQALTQCTIFDNKSKRDVTQISSHSTLVCVVDCMSYIQSWAGAPHLLQVCTSSMASSIEVWAKHQTAWNACCISCQALDRQYFLLCCSNVKDRYHC